MRPDNSHHAARTRAVTAIPAAIVGSLAIAMSATPAHGSENARPAHPVDLRALSALDRATLAHPASPRAVGSVPDAYEVQPGDTVWAIAARHGLRTADMLAINGLDSSSVIHPGQTLRLVGAIAAPAVPSAPAEQTPGAMHVVAEGDTISAIAGRYGVSVPAVLSANGLDWSSVIHPGQTVSIPGAAAPAPAPSAPPVPTAAAVTHLVVAGDTISAIAASYGVTSQAVLAANGLSASSIIYPGEALSIPVAVSPVLAARTEPVAASTVLDAEQVANVAVIVQVGRDLGVSERGIAIALGTAMQESWLRNLDWGDRDSLGLFQQRPSSGWGTAEEVRDPARAARAFYGGPSDPNGALTRGLLDIPGWQDMSFADAAQAVQISAYPERYAQWEQPAYAWLAAHG